MNFGLNEVRGIIPPDWRVIDKYSYYSYLVKNDLIDKAIFKKSGAGVIARLKRLASLGYTPQVFWSRGDYMIREWIAGINWKLYIDEVELTEELALWYIEENYRMWKITGGHGDLIWYNVLITPDKKIKWIDINVRGEGIDTFSRQMSWHTYKMFTPEEVIELTKTFK